MEARQRGDAPFLTATELTRTMSMTRRRIASNAAQAIQALEGSGMVRAVGCSSEVQEREALRAISDAPTTDCGRSQRRHVGSPRCPACRPTTTRTVRATSARGRRPGWTASRRKTKCPSAEHREVSTLMPVDPRSSDSRDLPAPAELGARALDSTTLWSSRASSRDPRVEGGHVGRPLTASSKRPTPCSPARRWLSSCGRAAQRRRDGGGALRCRVETARRGGREVGKRRGASCCAQRSTGGRCPDESSSTEPRERVRSRRLAPRAALSVAVVGAEQLSTACLRGRVASTFALATTRQGRPSTRHALSPNERERATFSARAALSRRDRAGVVVPATM